MTRSGQRRELLLSALTVVISAVTVLTCTALGGSRGAKGSSVKDSTTPPLGGSSDHPPSAIPVGDEPEPTILNSWIAPTDLGRAPEGNAIPRVPRFYEALARLATGLRHDHVRIVWLGDSHTQADVWTHAVRARLQDTFGNGGPGFVHVGWDTYGYRHEHISLFVGGTWSIRPLTLVSVTQVDDGVFGLGGVRLVPRGMDSTATLRVSPKGLPGKGLWDVAVRFVQEDAKVLVRVDGTEHRVEANVRSLGSIVHVQLETRGPGGELRVEQAWGKPEMMGVVVESADRHGVVVDTLGLNGARVRSALAWDEASWTAELARREPDLVVLAFGTNESSDLKLKAERHAERVRALIARIRKAAPGADCLIFGPIDRGGADYGAVIERINEAQKSAAEESGCAYWNGQLAMGGPGSMQRWATMAPPLGGGDRIHLYPRGYQKLGEMLVRDLLQGYKAGAPLPEGQK